MDNADHGLYTNSSNERLATDKLANPLSAALAYAVRGWPVFPLQWRAGPWYKKPLIKEWPDRATTDPRAITNWWRRWPRALIGTPTGLTFVVLDIDVKHPPVSGFRTLVELGFTTLPSTLTSKTASGGAHLYFEPAADRIIHNCVASLPGLDWKGHRGFVVLPSPGNGYEWVEDTRLLPLAPVPTILLPPKLQPRPRGVASTCTTLNDYGEAALRSATENILTADKGTQEATFTTESLKIGSLAGAGGVPAALALDLLIVAARAMQSYRPGEPWDPTKVERKVRNKFALGMANPRVDLLRELERAVEAACAAEVRNV